MPIRSKISYRIVMETAFSSALNKASIKALMKTPRKASIKALMKASTKASKKVLMNMT